MNIASLLKSEISRVARKEVRADTQALKKSSAKYRSEIADLKRRLAEVERLVKQLSKGTRKAVDAATGESATVVRYSAKNLASQRKRLGLSAADFGKLLGVSGAAVYLWEKGETRPRPAQMPAIAVVRKMSKKNAADKLVAMK